jgi:hypothetical protein
MTVQVQHSHRIYRKEVLDAGFFETLDEVQETTYACMESYNERRSHDIPGGMPPVVCRERITREVPPSQVYS